MFDSAAIWLALGSFFLGIGGTVLAFRSDLRNLTTRFEANVTQQALERKNDKQVLRLQLGYLTERLEDIAAVLNVAKRDSDVTRKFLALGAGDDDTTNG